MECLRMSRSAHITPAAGLTAGARGDLQPRQSTRGWRQPMGRPRPARFVIGREEMAATRPSTPGL